MDCLYLLFTMELLIAPLTSLSLDALCREYILYSAESLNDNFPVTTSLHVTFNWDFGSPILSRNVTPRIVSLQNSSKKYCTLTLLPFQIFSFLIPIKLGRHDIYNFWQGLQGSLCV